MDEPRSRRRVAIVVAVALGLLGLVLYAGGEVLRDDGSQHRAPVPGAANGPSGLVGSGSQPSPTAPSAPSSTVAPAVPDDAPPGPESTDVYSSEACVTFRGLLGLVDDARLRDAARTVGCI